MPVPPSTLPSTNPSASQTSTVSISFAQGGSTCILRPNVTVRGNVDLRLIKPCYATGIRVRLRAEESAIVLGQESNGDSLRQKFQQTVITLFDTETMVFGTNLTDNELSNWREIAAGQYSFPFALKVPNVNFPPCIPNLEGFSVRYVWTAHVDGPFENSLFSEEVLCQFLPNVLAPKPLEWTYHDTVGAIPAKNSTQQLNKPPTGIDISIKMHQQIYVPGDPLYMATTLVNNTQHKVVGVDVVLQRTVRGTMSTSYANLSNQVTTEIISKSSDCKVRGGETGQVDILATVPPMGKTSLVPTFESNFLKIYYELICVIRVKRSVFAGGDTTYQFTIPVPIATHNIDNPTISGRTPRWTKSRMQPYFFDHTWDNPAGDFPPQLVEEAPQVTNAVVIDSPSVRSGTPNSASAMSMTSSPSMNASAMQEFLASGSVGLHRERTMKKSLSRSKSLKDIQSARLNGSSWRAEKEHLLNQSREMGNNAGLSRSVTDAAPGGGSSSRRSPPLDAKSKASNEEKLGSGVGTTVVDGDGNVGYTPPPPSGATPRTQKSVNREMTPDQQAELARKASRRILPNQGLYTNEGVLPPELAHTGNQYPVPIPTPANNASAAPTVVNDYGNNSMNGNGNVGANSMSNRANNLSYSPPTPTTPISMAKIPPRRNASLSEKSHYQQQGGSGSGPYTQEPEPFEIPTRSGSQVNLNGNGFYDSSNGSRGRNGNGSSNGTGQTRSNQGSYQEGNRYGQESRSQPQPRTLSPQPVGGNKPVYPSSDRTPERVPYQHSLPAHQQPPGVVPGEYYPVPPAVNTPTSTAKDSLENAGHRRTGSSGNNNFYTTATTTTTTNNNNTATTATVTNGNSNGNSSSDNNIARVNSGNYSALRIPPWERVEKVRHQNWFKPGPHQAGALQTFDVAGLVPSTLQAVPIVKKSTPRPMSPVQIEAAMN